MRKNITFGLICFAMIFGVAGGAFATLGTGEISMGTFSIPLPADGKDGKDGCTPEITISEKNTSTGCYTVTTQKKKLEGGACVNDGSSISRETCDGDKGDPGDPVSVGEEYVPYPASTHFDGMPDEPQNEGYIKKIFKRADGGNVGIVKEPDICEEFYENGITKKKCTAQGNAINWPNSNGTGIYQTGETYIFAVEQLDAEYPRDEYTTPRLSGGNSGYPTAPGVTNKVYKYTSGRTWSEFVAEDTCAEYAKPTDTSDRVKKCTVWAPANTSGLTSPYTAGATYCLGDHQSDCGQYTVLVGAVDTCATLSSTDTAWGTTVDHIESEYTDTNYDSSCTTNCSGTPGYKIIKEVMCDGTAHETTQNDTCSPAQSTSVTCASGYIWQTCTKQTAVADTAHATYSGCFPDPFNDLYARRTDIIPANFAADSNYLYYCRRSDCDTNAACWVDGQINVTPLWNSTNGCWGRVSVTGLQGANGESCFVTNDGTNWNMCCSPTYTGGDCSVITDTDIIEKLQGMMCHVNYTHKYLHDDGDGGVVANATKAGAIGERVIVTNSCNSDSENLDAYYGQDGEDGEDGDNYDPCDGLQAGSVDAQTTIQSQTSVYRARTYSPNHFNPARGYYEKTINYCEGSATTYEADECKPVSLAAGDSRTVGSLTCNANQTLMRCTPQEGSTTPYFICEDAEVSGYPKKKYFQPTTSGGKITAAGYSALMHKYTSDGSEVVETTQRNTPDECHKVCKTNEPTTSGNTRTTTTTCVLQCTVQNYTYPSQISGWTNGTTYCLNAASATASTSCEGYGDGVITSELKYHLPIMDTTNTTTPVAPGWAYREEKSGSVAVRESGPDKDDCKQYLTRTTSGNATTTASVWKCTVSAPGNSGAGYAEGREYCLGYTGGTCPGSLIDIGAAVDDAAEGDPCAGSTSATAVKKVESRTYSRTANSQGAMVSTYKMCDDSTHTESTPDECKQIPTPLSGTGSDCTGAWMQCKRQAAEGTNSAGTTYEYCAVYPQCVGNTTSSTIVKKTQRSYTAPTGSSGNGTSKYYTTVGKITDVKIACNGTPISTEESAEDQCEEVADDATPVCPTTAKVRKKCKRQGKESTSLGVNTEYTLCTTGTSIFDAIADNDPCGGDTTSDVAKKKVKSIQYEYITKDATGNTAKVGYSKKTTTMCNPAGNTDEYIYDTCVPDASESTCNGANDKYYKCYNQSKLYSANASEREYNTCNPSADVSSVALSNKIDGKLDNDVTFSTAANSNDSNKEYIFMSSGGVSKPVVPVDTLKPQSLFDTWKEEQIQFVTDDSWSDAQCQAMYGANCNKLDEALTTNMMFESFTDYGRWKQEQVEGGETDAADLTTTSYRQSLQPCQNGFTITNDDSYQGEGNKYIMSCVD